MVNEAALSFWAKVYETYQFYSNNVPVLGVRLVVRVLHQCVVLQNAFPVLLVFAIGRILPCKLLNSDLMTVKVLEDQVVEI